MTYLLQKPDILDEVWEALAEAERALPALDVVPVILSPGSRETRRFKTARKESECRSQDLLPPTTS
jgi:hypothetical protein